jgi:fructoselysine-6-P-deglycase FrlB-like protein
VGSIDKRDQKTSGSPLALMKREIQYQILQLPAFASEIEQSNVAREFSPSSMVFAGAGDSYAASLFAHYYSGGHALAADPSELAQTPDLCDNKIVYITSVSGRTRANIQLARRIRRIARQRVAVSAEPGSPLARECEQTIVLPYSSKDMITPGTLSFTLSLLVVASRITALPRLQDLGHVNRRAVEWARKLEIHPRSGFLFVGSGIGYAMAAYGAFKIQEVLGQPADYVHSEQFGHSKLFSIRESDNIVCFASGRDKKAASLSRILGKNGFDSHLLTSHSQDPVIAGLEASFCFQHLALRISKMRGLKDAAFLTDESRLALSSRLIY